jgi:hypothetical protein
MDHFVNEVIMTSLHPDSFNRSNRSQWKVITIHSHQVWLKEAHKKLENEKTMTATILELQVKCHKLWCLTACLKKNTKFWEHILGTDVTCGLVTHYISPWWWEDSLQNTMNSISTRLMEGLSYQHYGTVADLHIWALSLLRYYANSLLTFGDNLSIPTSRVMRSLKDGAERLYWNIGKELPFYAV